MTLSYKGVGGTEEAEFGEDGVSGAGFDFNWDGGPFR